MKEKIRLENSLFVKAFTLSILKTINPNLFVQRPREVINADLIPRVSEKIMKRGLMKKSAVPRSHLMQIPLKPRQIFVSPAPKNFQMSEGEYGQLDFLLKDRTVSSIECSGPGQEIVIVRAGQKQFTKIVLGPEEINKFLEKIAEKAMVPLMEGVFKVAVNDFFIKAIVSEMVGSRFVIKKQTPYALLEPGS